MLKVKFNSDNFMNVLKKGLSFVVAAATIGSLSGCDSGSSSVSEDTAPSSSLVGDMFEPTTDPAVYDFEGNVILTEPVITEMFDWSKTKETVLANNDEAWELTYTGHDIVTGLSENKYGVVICETTDGFGDIYYRIVDSDGNYINDDKIEMAYNIDGHTLLCQTVSDIERDFKEKIVYTIFDQITGKSIDVKAVNLTEYNGFLIKTNYDDKEGYSYELLTKDGMNATGCVYEATVFDYDTNILYLSKDGVTEALDTNTLKARKISGTVRDASDGYVVLETQVGEKNNSEKSGVLYLADVNEEPTLMIPYEYDYMNLIIEDAEKPLFTCTDWDSEAFDFKRKIVDKNGNIIIGGDTDYRFFSTWYGTDLIKACSHAVTVDDETIYLYDVFDSNGQEVISNITYDYFQPIPGTDKAIFRAGKDDKCGVMNFEGKYLVMPSFDELYSAPILVEEDGVTKIVDCHLIGRINDSNKTIIFNKDLEIIATGDFGYNDANDIAYGHYAEESASKVLTK